MALPSYLQTENHASPCKENVIECGNLRITLLTDRLVRIEQGEYTDDATLVVICRDLGAVRYQLRTEGTHYTIETESLRIVCDGQTADLTQAVCIESKGYPAFRWQPGMHPLHNLKGTTETLDRVNGECELGDGVCSMDGYAVIDDSSTPVFTAEGWFAPRKQASDLYFFGYGHDYTAAVQDYMRMTGRTEMLPAFVFGNWWSRYWKYSEREYLELMDRFRTEDIPFSVGIVDMDWHLTDQDGRDYSKDGWTGYTWNPDLFPDHKRFLKEIHKRNLHTALNLHPAQGVRSFDVQYEAMCRAMGKDPVKGTPVHFNCLDPKFLKAYFEVLHFPYEQEGVDFWWMDWQQGTDYRKIAGEDYKETGLDCINPLFILNHMHYQASKRDGKRGLIFSRFGGFGSQRYPIGFSGDTVITWESLDFQPYFTATASNIGYGWWSHDIGGHMGGYRDDDLTVRWIQLGVFSPIFRLHSTSNPFLGREPWNYGLAAEKVIGEWMRLRHRLFPYLYTMNRRTSEELIPLIRPMYHLYPECPEAYQVKNQYFFGSEMMVAPITSPQNTVSCMGSVKVWFPEGEWIDAFTGFRYHGGQMLWISRPIQQMPVFLKTGAIVPLQGHHMHDNHLGASEDMEVWAAAGADGSFSLYEDDGETTDYRHGVYAVTKLTMDWGEEKAFFTIHPVENDTHLVPQVRTWTIAFRGMKPGCSFVVNGQEISAVRDEAINGYRVTLKDVSAEKGVVLTLCSDQKMLTENECSERILMDRINHAQCELGAKDAMYDHVSKVMEELSEGKCVERKGFEFGQHLGMENALFEILSQLPVHNVN